MKPKVLSVWSDAFPMLCKATGKWGIWVSWLDADDIEEVVKACPWLSEREHAGVLLDGCAIVLCETEAEVMALYDQVIGEDGPTRRNPYNGPVRVYALTCDPTGEGQDENT